jgi:O-methyltransferase
LRANLKNIPGDIVECGVWNGGSAAVMGVACYEGSTPSRRKFWLFDSFQGLPRPGEHDGKFERDAYFQGWNRGEINKVNKIFTSLRIPLDELNIIPGWFEATLKETPIKEIAMLHVDVDWYDSVTTVLETLYCKVVPDGYIVLRLFLLL